MLRSMAKRSAFYKSLYKVSVGDFLAGKREIWARLDSFNFKAIEDNYAIWGASGIVFQICQVTRQVTDTLFFFPENRAAGVLQDLFQWEPRLRNNRIAVASLVWRRKYPESICGEGIDILAYIVTPLETIRRDSVVSYAWEERMSHPHWAFSVP